MVWFVSTRRLQAGAAVLVLLLLTVLSWDVHRAAMQAAAQIVNNQAQVEAWKQEGVLLFGVKTAEKAVVLTFDDGPDPVYTPQILAILRQYGVKATFFPIGQHVAENPDLARQVIAEGHEMGNHTYSHVYFVTTGAEEIEREIKQAEATIQEVTGQAVRLLRPPGGIYHARIIDIARSLGYRVIIWTWKCNPGDAYGPGVPAIVKKVVEGASNGAIILLHEAGRHPEQTLAALPQIIEKLQAEGYRFALLSELVRNEFAVTGTE